MQFWLAIVVEWCCELTACLLHLLTVKKAERRKYLLAIISHDSINCKCTVLKSQPHLQINMSFLAWKNIQSFKKIILKIMKFWRDLVLSQTFKKYVFFIVPLQPSLKGQIYTSFSKQWNLEKALIFLKKGKTFGIRFESSEIGKKLVTLPHPDISDEGQIVTSEAIILRMGKILTFKTCRLWPSF